MSPTAQSDVDIQIAEDAARFYADPLGFVRWAYPWGQPGMLEKHDGPDEWQCDVLAEIGRQVKERKFDGRKPVEPVRIVVVSGHGVGKTTLFAWVTHWIMSTRPRCRGTVTAMTFTQLQTKTWAAIQQWGGLLINKHWFKFTGEQMFYINHRESWAVSAQSCKEENSEAFAGQHAADSSSFYLIDEGSGVPEKIWEVAEGGLTDGEPIIIAAGNPTRNTGKFQRIAFGNERNRWTKFSVDSRKSKFSNKALIQQWADDYGEDSDFFRVRVRGECPRAGSTQLIPSDVVAAARKYIAVGYEFLPKIIAVDVARFGDARSVICLRQGRRARILAKLRGVDLVQLAERVIAFMQSEQPAATVIDGDGLGGGVVDHIRHRGFREGLHEFHGGTMAYDPDAYYNRRAEIWAKMGMWLKEGAQIDDDAELETDLTTPQYGYSAKNQIQLEKKDDMRARGAASPDLGDALAMTFAVTVQPKVKVKPYDADAEYRAQRLRGGFGQWM